MGVNLRRRRGIQGYFSIHLAAFCDIVVLNINIGSVPIDSRLPASSSRERRRPAVAIIWKICRRTAMAAILGGALSLSGFLPQTFS